MNPVKTLVVPLFFISCLLAGCQLPENSKRPDREDLYRLQQEKFDQEARDLLQSLRPEAVLQPDSLKQKKSPERVYISRFQDPPEPDTLREDSLKLPTPVPVSPIAPTPNQIPAARPVPATKPAALPSPVSPVSASPQDTPTAPGNAPPQSSATDTAIPPPNPAPPTPDTLQPTPDSAGIGQE